MHQVVVVIEIIRIIRAKEETGGHEKQFTGCNDYPSYVYTSRPVTFAQITVLGHKALSGYSS
jgi:hypothetical protein